MLNPDGTLTFTPNENYNNSTPLPVTYTIEDPNGETASATIRITIDPVNDAPVANDDGPVPTTANTPVRGNVLPNDTDADGDTLTVTQFNIPGVGDVQAGTPATIPGVGTLVINPNGSYTFTPNPGYVGPVPAVTYTITDGNGGGDTATLSFADVPPAAPAPAPEPAPAPPPPPPPPPAPAPSDVTRPTPPAPVPAPAPVPSTPDKPATLHVLYAVAEARNVGGTVNSPLGTVQANAPLLGEAAAQVPDSLLFENNSRGGHIGLIRERSFGEVQVMRPDLYVTLAVRHQPITTDPSLWVQHAVRSSQLESQVRGASMEGNNSAAPGYSTLVDPFALGAPQPEGSPVKVAESEAVEPRQDAVAKGAAEPQPASEPVKAGVETADKVVEKPRAAAGLRDQLQRFAKDRAVSARPITRSTVSS